MSQESAHGELRRETHGLLHGSLRHVQGAALAALLVPVGVIAANQASAQLNSSGGVVATVSAACNSYSLTVSGFGLSEPGTVSYTLTITSSGTETNVTGSIPISPPADNSGLFSATVTGSLGLVLSSDSTVSGTATVFEAGNAGNTVPIEVRFEGACPPPVVPPHVDHANVAADCSGYTITADGGTLQPGLGPYTLDYTIVLTPASGPSITINRSLPIFPNSPSDLNFVATETKTWAELGVALTGAYALSGTAKVNTGDTAVNIAFTPNALTCNPPPGPHLTITKNPKSGTFTQGSQVSFSIVVGNDGGSQATNVHLHDQLPDNGGLVWAGATSTQGSCLISPTSVLDCGLGTIPASGSVTVIVASATPTPSAACQLQPNPHAIATADGGLQVEDSGSLSCTPPPLPCPAGSFSFSFDAAGNLRIVYDQFPAPNDNSYGVNAVGWGTKGHTFNDLVGSDHAGFQFRNASGVVVLSFNIDYLSANANAPSGYASLGPFGGDGSILVGSLTPADIGFTTSLANNLNNVNIPGLFNAAHVQQFGSVNVLVASPPTDPQHQTYTASDPILAGWDFHDTYFVQISAAKLAAIGFDPATWKVEPNLSALHNSPAKACPPATSPGGSSLSVTKVEVKDKQVKITILNNGSVDEFLTAVKASWPAANGKLLQVKLDGDVIYDKPDIPPPSANLTVAQLVADQNKRKINHGTSDVLTLIFEKNADKDLSHYTGTVSTSGFGLTILP
jgi:uncharacterized repeat protein (TIGR01451 family)